MKILNYIAALLMVFTLASCKKDPYKVYTDIARLQFGPDVTRIYSTTAMLADTLKQSTFYYDNATVNQDTVFFDIYAIGLVANHDRAFTLTQVQVANTDNAISGQDFVAFNDPKATKNFVIKAGSSHALVPIILLRSAVLKTKALTLKFNIMANENFQLGELNYIWRKVVFTDKITKPASWNDRMTTNYLGVYSLVKYEFIIKNTGQKWDEDFMAAMLDDTGELAYWLIKIKVAFAAYNNSHPGNPLRDENGELVLFP